MVVVWCAAEQAELATFLREETDRDADVTRRVRCDSLLMLLNAAQYRTAVLCCAVLCCAVLCCAGHSSSSTRGTGGGSTKTSIPASKQGL